MHSNDPPERNPSEHSDAEPSKSQRKRDAQALQALGAQLIALSPAQLENIALPAELQEAVLAAQAINSRSHGAGKRQLKFIGKLLRELDSAPIAAALAALDQASAQAKSRHHRLERLVEQLLSAETKTQQAAFDDIFNHSPEADRQQLRQLIRSAHREREKNPDQASKSRRLLFRYLRDLDTD